MMRIPHIATALMVGTLLTGTGAHATSFHEIAFGLGQQTERWWEASGMLRVRGSFFHNLDLDHGLTPSGQSLFPTPLSDPSGQLLTAADMRMRADLGAHTPGGAMAVRLRVDVLDNLSLGDFPEGAPAATVTQRPPDSAFRVKRAYGMALTPFGYIAAGRMGNHWGLGMLANGGECDDCDSGDASDRIAFITSLGGHLWALSYDFSATGPQGPRKGGAPGVDLDPTDNVSTLTFAFMKIYSDVSLERRREADRLSVEYGAYVSHRWQTRDVPADYLPTAALVPITASQSMRRNYTATAVDGWMRVTNRWMRLEAEAAVLIGNIEQASLIPGALLKEPIESLQVGFAFESEFGRRDDTVVGGLNFGYASGDPAPGFGVNPGPTDAFPRAGDLDGPQANPGRDNRVDNFRFHPDYRVDRILWREIIGTITDAVYIRPHVHWKAATIGPGVLSVRFAAIASLAAEPNSTPSGDRGLGIELDPSIEYVSRDGFGLQLDYAVLFPLSGLDNRVIGLNARVAQLVRLHVRYAF